MNKPSSCNSCTLGSTSMGFSLPHGMGTSGVVIVGDCLSHGDYQEGKPLARNTGEGGKLAGTIRLAGAAPEQFHYTSLVRCFPPHGGLLSGMPYEASAVAGCARHLREALQGFQTPRKRILLALGDAGIRALTGMTGRDKDKQGMKFIRGYIFDSEYGPVIPSYHPRTLLAGNQHLTPCLEADIRLALAYARGSVDYTGEMEKKKYNKFPSLEDAKSYYHMLASGVNLPITYDIETAQEAILDEDERDKARITNAEITQIQFSHAKHHAIVFPWKYPYIDVARDIMALRNSKAGFNCWNFDNKVMEQRGGIQLAGTNHDLMWMWKQWQPRLHRNLQSVCSFFLFPFPWKHLFDADVEFYGCADVDGPQYILEKLPKMMQDFGCWNIYMQHLRQYYEVALKPASDRGIPVNQEKHSRLARELEVRRDTLLRQAREMIPEEIIPLGPRRVDKKTKEVSFGYKTLPPKLKRLGKAWIAAKQTGRRMRWRTFEEAARDQLGLIRKEGIWYKLGEFTPNSSKQIMAYLNWMKKHLTEQGEIEEAKLYEIPTVIKKGIEKQTTGKDALSDIVARTDDKVLSMVLEARSIGKLLSNDLPNWLPASDGCVHTEWHFGPPTGQMGSRTPNVLNASKHTDVGQLFRGIIEAP